MTRALILVDFENEWVNKKSEGTKIITGLHKQNSDTIITKHRISPFYKTSLERDLKGIKDIAVCGILTNLCVRSLVQEAYDSKTHNFTISDLKTTRPKIGFLELNNFLRQATSRR